MEIVNEISSKIPLKSETLKELVGMDSHLEKLTILMDKGPNDIRMIGICDIGGIGKAALAKVVYNLIYHEFEIVSRDHGTYGTSVGASIVGNRYKRIANLEKFWGSLKSLTMLILDGTAIRELPLSVEYLTGLVVLNFKDWQNLECLLSPISGLKSLKILNLSGCSTLENVPENLGKVDSLEELDISGTAIRQLPTSVSILKNLKPVDHYHLHHGICASLPI
ncbi:TMV resistance protein N-like [Citrus clementina]|uniref:TMV resistance protein N-like n=1 Tax=Citrus clementina TaxID=85681 RepID=UPI000CED7321|nr:TMV resistance protein N-like [Citrus x clementina]